MSHSSSGSSESEDMVVRLSDIRSFAQLFRIGVLKTAAKHRYKPDAALLDRVSLLYAMDDSRKIFPHILQSGRHHGNGGRRDRQCCELKPTRCVSDSCADVAA